MAGRPGLAGTMMAKSSKKHKENSEFKLLEELFNIADKNGDGRVTVEDLFEAAISSGLEADRKHIEGWFLNKDRDRDGELTWDEVLGIKTTNEIAFDTFDLNKDGRISKKEFLHICRNMTDEQVDAVLQKFGKKKEGQMNYDEFCQMMNKRRKSSLDKLSSAEHEICPAKPKIGESSQSKYEVP